MNYHPVCNNSGFNLRNGLPVGNVFVDDASTRAKLRVKTGAAHT